MAKSEKKVVRAEALPDAVATTANDDIADDWQPTPEAKQQATTFRIISWVAWVLAIGAEAFAIFWLLRQVPFETVHLIWLIVIAVAIAGLAITGPILWKKANHLDPASKKQPVRLFVQNQLGVLMTLLAFVPLIVLILTNKNMDGKQKAIAGSVAGVLAIVALVFAPDLAPVSREDIAADQNAVVKLTGKDEVFWTKAGSVYHLCQQASAVNLQSKDGTIYSGTVTQAVAAGKNRLTKQVDLELKQCGITPPAGTASSAPAPSASATK
ncbi:MAG: hypothetical protein LWW77_12585 [Propionibacteriales bacterium]|nr:hypothetical protein [Propionibacteriales bacterium]